ncbi:membrane associated guanylate kinase-related [Holotrichia oblita]|uniref:Membrane associated guanylate kinase-related n=1 Tax=Holotrichia oblita TaxID=644536 RepID=A0ACB9SVM5_HOLOL|nr:membrane associated guanylate kinase-related [Holotrichia oblita]
MLLQSTPSGADEPSAGDPMKHQTIKENSDFHSYMLDYAPAPGWTVHSTKEGRLYYCNHVTRTAGWLPPAEAWKPGDDNLPYGWERAVDDSGRSYYINHVNKTTTYETPITKNLEPVKAPEPRTLTLERSPALGFGFVAGSEKPVIVRFVTEGGPSVDKLLPGDQIWQVNGEDVKLAPREHVIQLVRACSTTVTLTVCQPTEQQGARKSTLLSASKRARLKSKPSRVRFAESVCVNGAPLFPIASRPGAHKLRCLYRIAFVPSSAGDLAQTDLVALDYLFIQCCNDVIQERFAPELQYDTALRLAALHIYQHALANNIPGSKLTVKTIEREFGLERFVPASLLEKMKRKEVRKLVAHFLKLHANMAGPGKQLTSLQAKLHYLDIVGQLPSYGAKCFSAGPKADIMERVILVSPKFGISQITGTRNSVPVPIANIEDMKGIEVRIDDELFRTVLIKLVNDQAITVSLEERDANELVLVLRGYYRLCTGEHLQVDKDESQPVEDLAPPYLSQHKVLPEKWSYINQNQVKTICFAMQPVYQVVNKKTNGLYNTMGRQSKSLTSGLSLDNNMNSPISNRNHQLKQDLSFDTNFDLQSVVSMEILESGDAKNEEIFKRVQEMQQLVENSEKYLTEQEQLERLNSAAEWQETSVDIDSDNESCDDIPGTLKHSDSLLLLAKGTHAAESKQQIFTNAAIEMLRSELNQSESDNDSLYTPHNSPKHKKPERENSKKSSRISFGLHSPDNPNTEAQDLKSYLQQLKECKSDDVSSETGDMDNISDLYVFDPDIIDLTMLPPPATPDELDCALLPTPINVPPSSFADSVEKLNKLGVLHENLDLEEFLASVTIPPPMQKVTPAVELTPEEIMSYIIPPPPDIGSSFENCAVPDKTEATCESLPVDLNKNPPSRNGSLRTNDIKRRNSNCSVKSNIIEYATVDRKGAFSCCAKNKEKKNPDGNCIQPPPRRSSEEKPPERPPKNLPPAERQRSHSLTSHMVRDSGEFPPKLPPKGEVNHQAPPHLFLPPKKPPLPPVPPLEVLRSRKIVPHPQQKPNPEIRTAGIGSPHLQRNRNMYSDLDSKFGNVEARKATAISTPTSPYLGRGGQLTAVPIISPDETDCCNHDISTPPLPPTSSSSGTQQHNRSYSDSGYNREHVLSRMKSAPTESSHFNGSSHNTSVRNGCMSTRENLLAKTDVAMASLLVRLDHIAAQCNAAQVHGGGKMMCEEKFQIAKDELTAQSLQLVHSSKMLVIAMSDPTLPDLPENLAVCLTILRKLTDLCQNLSNHTTSPLQTRNLVLKVHDVTAAFRHLITSNVDRSSQAKIEEHLAKEAESLANVLTTLLRSLRVFSP